MRLMNGAGSGVMAENARTLRNQGQPEDMALKMAAKQAAMGAAGGGSAMGALGAGMAGGLGGMHKQVMPGGEALGGEYQALPAMGGFTGEGAGGGDGMMPLPSDPHAPNANAPAIAIPGAGNPPPPQMGAPSDNDWIQQIMGRFGQGGMKPMGQAGSRMGGMSALAGLLGRR